MRVPVSVFVVAACVPLLLLCACAAPASAGVVASAASVGDKHVDDSTLMSWLRKGMKGKANENANTDNKAKEKSATTTAAAAAAATAAASTVASKQVVPPQLDHYDMKSLRLILYLLVSVVAFIASLCCACSKSKRDRVAIAVSEDILRHSDWLNRFSFFNNYTNATHKLRKDTKYH